MGATYAKLPKSTTDYSSGIQSVNQLRDNGVADFTAFALEHGIGEPTVRPNGRIDLPLPPKTLGRHDTPKVVRAVVRTRQYTSSFGVISPGLIEAPQVVTGITRLATGVWFISLAHLIEFYAECEAEADSSTPLRVVIPRSSIGGNGAPIGVGVELYEVDGANAMALSDFDFVAHIYGTA